MIVQVGISFQANDLIIERVQHAFTKAVIGAPAWFSSTRAIFEGITNRSGAKEVECSVSTDCLSAIEGSSYTLVTSRTLLWGRQKLDVCNCTLVPFLCFILDHISILGTSASIQDDSEDEPYQIDRKKTNKLSDSVCLQILTVPFVLTWHLIILY